jgi:signal transduction histidine kinase/ActR/RegA family two-component response regulator
VAQNPQPRDHRARPLAENRGGLLLIGLERPAGVLTLSQNSKWNHCHHVQIIGLTADICRIMLDKALAGHSLQLGSLFPLILGLLAKASGKWRVVEVEEHKKEVEAAVEEHTRKLAHEKESAEAANLTKSQFLANMSREIRTPMTSVLGTLELTLSTKLTDEQREYIELSRSSAQSLLALLDDILDFSTAEAEELEISHVEFSLRHCVRGALSVIAGRVEQKGVTLREDIAASVPDRLRGDPDRLRKVLLKIIEQSANVSSGGTIVVGVRLDKQTVDDGPSPARSTPLLFLVQHTGSNVTRAQQETLFEPPSEVHGSVSRTYGGTGIGLAVCGRLVRLMEGRIWLDSEEGHGNRFYFTSRFELANLSRPRTLPSDSLQRRDSAVGATVLVAEDNRVNQIVVVRLLEKRGINALVASNGTEAIEMLTKAQIDLILMDIEMPEMNGHEATRRIREQEKITGLHVPIVALTAHAMKGDREKCIAAGMDGYLTKPLEGNQLIQTIEELLVVQNADITVPNG